MITVHNNFLSEELIKRVTEEVKKASEDNAFYCSNFKWGSNIVQGSMPVLCYEISHKNPELFHDLALYDQEVLNLDFDKAEKFGKSLFFWSNNSYIPWHADETYDWASSLYLNSEWHRDWGGFFMYEDGEEIKAIKPEFNLCVEQTNNIPHATTAVSPGDTIPFRISLQSFVTWKK